MQTFYHVLWYLCIYSFFGWCGEVAFHAMTYGDFQNRGFLNGPVCPIYGFGALLIIALLKPFSGNLVVLFVSSVIVTSLLELVTGYLLEKIFKSKWWDYSDMPYNIKGYICLKFSVIWGFVCVFALKIVHPAVVSFVTHIPEFIGIIIAIVFAVIFICDAAMTVITLFKLKNRLKFIEDVSKEIREMSDSMGSKISDAVLNAVDKKNELNMEKRKEEYEKKLRAAVVNMKHGQKRLLKAFPSVSSKRFGNAISKLKEQYKK